MATVAIGLGWLLLIPAVGPGASAVRDQAGVYEAALLKKDKAVLDHVLHPDFQFQSLPDDLAGGDKRDAILLNTQPHRTFRALKTSRVRIRVFGDSAVETGLLSAELSGNQIWGNLEYTRVWVREGKNLATRA